jgi:hypothetical protein
MSLLFSPVSRHATKALAGVDAFSERPKVQKPRELRIVGSIPMFIMSSTKLRRKDLLREIRVSYWRFLVFRNRRASEIVDLESKAGVFKIAMVRFTEANAWQDAIEAANRLAECNNRDYRILGALLPSLQIEAVCLKPVRGSGSLYFAIVPDHHDLGQGSFLSEADFLKSIRDLSQLRRIQVARSDFIPKLPSE